MHPRLGTVYLAKEMEEGSKAKTLEEKDHGFSRSVWFMEAESQNSDLLDTWHITYYFIMKL